MTKAKVVREGMTVKVIDQNSVWRNETGIIEYYDMSFVYVYIDSLIVRFEPDQLSLKE